MSLNSARAMPSFLLALLMAGLCLLTSIEGHGAIVPRETPERFELEFWRAIKDSSDPDEFSAYLESFPKGKFAPLARIRLKSLQRSTPSSSSQPAPVTRPTPEPAVEAPEPEVVETAPEPASTPTPAPQSNSETAATETPAESTNDESQSSVSPVANSSIKPFRDCTLCPEMVDIPPGEFLMGSNEGDATSAPAHTVRLDYPFAAGRFELTHEQWEFCVSNGGCMPNARNEGLDANLPAINISWKDAHDYVGWLASYTHRPYRLPTEAEWEYFARAGSETNYWWGNEIIANSANCSECGGDWGRKLPAPVEAFAGNEFGLSGTSGGVAEWVQDCWSSNYQSAPEDGSAIERDNCIQRVLRGGSWRSNSDYLNSASRLNYDHNVRYVTNGFRVVLDADDFMQ